MNQYEILKHYFGYDTFRDGQEKLIRAILEGRDVLALCQQGQESPFAIRYRHL